VKTLIVGLTTRSIAESAVHSGYEVIALDAFADLDQQAMCECYGLSRDFQMPFGANALFTCSRGMAFDAVVYIANLENHPEVVRRFARRHRVLGNSPEVLARVRHWSTLFASLARAGYKTPQTIYDGEDRQADAGRVWLRKPVLSGGGHGISIYKNGQPAKRGFMLQEYIPGLPCSASFVANGREAVVIGLTEQLIGLPAFGACGFRYCGNLLPIAAARDSSIDEQIVNQAQHIATLLTREFMLVGVNGFDFILTGSQVCVTEVNPRYSASMELIERAYGLSIFDLHVRAVTREELPDFSLARIAREGSRRFFGKAILFAEKDALAPEIARWQERGIRDVPHPGENLMKGKPVCTLLAHGPDRDSCFARLVNKAEAIIGEIYAD
jgi:uncharacterized protein